MSDMDDYLQEGFEPRSVTMPRLRSILVTHNVEYPATAKKSQLVELVTDHVLSQAPRLRAQRAKAKRSSMGIVNAGSAEDTGTWDDPELLPPPPRSTRRSRSPRKAASRVKVEEDDMPTPVPPKRSARSTSRQLSHADDQESVDYEAPKSARRTKRSAPQIKQEPREEELPPPVPVQESVFTYDNPFQGGASSPQPFRTPTNRRRTAGGDALNSARSSSRRRTDGYADSTSFATPMAHSRKFEPESDPETEHQFHHDLEHELEPGEEFTPNEQLELEEAASRGETSLEARKPANQVARRSNAKAPLLVLLMSLLGAYMAWYRQEKIAVGFCGLGRPAKEILPSDVPVPDFLVPFIEPQCEPCPLHAYCYQDFSVRCEPDFILQPHPLSLGGIVPFPPSCEPDGEKARRVQAVADKAVEELRDRRARYECGDLLDEEGHKPESPSIHERELKESVSRKRSKRLNSDEFDELWAAAIGEVTAREEVDAETIETTTTSSSSPISDRRLSSSSLARLPLTCALKRSVKLGLARHRVAIGLLITSVLSIFYMRARYRKHVATSAQIPALVDLVLGRLASQKELGEEDIDDPWLFLPNLRDDVLRSVHSLSERERIWQRVRSVVELNSNVRTSQREGRSGEVGRAWEWIGPIAGEGVRRRRGKTSVGPEESVETPESKDVPETKLESSRPIF